MNRISEATALLRSASGFYDTPKLRKAFDRWLEERRVESAMDMDIIKDRFRRRAAVIGFRCGIIFMLLAVIGVIYYLTKDRMVGTYIILIAMCFKIAESSLRMLNK